MGLANTKSSIKPCTTYPLPYLFSSLCLVLILIAVALVLLACSYIKRPSNSSSNEVQLKQEMAKARVIDSEPKIVVIMAGDDKPTFLAKPAASSSSCRCGQV
ncbi:protein GLUTAMINE DUMPER 4-like [Durio zibethinus]|uniref:Protein GLUTAMINE DUMPER 4-like n=1 Tax=Durio zibethinus TaxID=66656 RepID=A0A6P6AYP6_DURZI|nr:protein GLUTAMINE DUMPER 4-like [Durio zibethinus]